MPLESVSAGLVRHLREGEVASITGLSRSTLQKMRLRGDGPPYVKLGTRVVFREDDLAEWLEAQPRRRSTSEQP